MRLIILFLIILSVGMFLFFSNLKWKLASIAFLSGLLVFVLCSCLKRNSLRDVPNSKTIGTIFLIIGVVGLSFQEHPMFISFYNKKAFFPISLVIISFSSLLLSNGIFRKCNAHYSLQRSIEDQEQ